MIRAWIIAAALALTACNNRPSNTLEGYGEADYIYLSSMETGIVGALFVHEGDAVQQGAAVFSLEPQRLQYNAQSVGADRAALAQAVSAAAADAGLAQRNYDRDALLASEGTVSRAQVDADRAARDSANARLAQARRQLNASSADSGLARQRLSDLSVAAPLAGTIERIYHREGEVVAAGAPVAALLTPANMKIRFYAPAPLLAHLQPGTQISISCDTSYGNACAHAFTAHISRVANEPQFTPPVIYSLDQKDKLVFLIEARVDGASPIQPGMPVTVHLP
jgi:HlyD family secretion protein